MTEARVVGSVATLELRRKADRPSPLADHMDRFVLFFWIASTALGASWVSMAARGRCLSHADSGRRL